LSSEAMSLLGSNKYNALMVISVVSSQGTDSSVLATKLLGT